MMVAMCLLVASGPQARDRPGTDASNASSAAPLRGHLASIVNEDLVRAAGAARPSVAHC
jgi:hypothetical protein